MSSCTEPSPRGGYDPRRASRRNAPRFVGPAHRSTGATSFRQGMDRYHDVRPGYPRQVTAMVRQYPRIADVGCGSGKLSGALAEAGHEVWALDPSPDMVRNFRSHLPMPVWRATAEATGLPDASVDAVTCAQTWHWLDQPAAAREWNRVVRDGGRVMLVWNTLDTKDPWVLRLTRIMHAGDILRPGFTPDVPEPWRPASELRLRWTHRLWAADLFALTATRSYWLSAGEKDRRRVAENLAWFLYDHSGLGPDSPVTLPYRCDAFLLARG